MTIEQVVEEALEKINGGIPPLDGNRFDKLVAIRDEAQRLIAEDRDAEFTRTQNELKELAAQLAAKKLRMDGLDKIASVKAKRSDAGKPRTAKAAKG